MSVTGRGVGGGSAKKAAEKEKAPKKRSRPQQDRKE